MKTDRKKSRSDSEPEFDFFLVYDSEEEHTAHILVEALERRRLQPLLENLSTMRARGGMAESARPKFPFVVVLLGDMRPWYTPFGISFLEGLVQRKSAIPVLLSESRDWEPPSLFASSEPIDLWTLADEEIDHLAQVIRGKAVEGLYQKRRTSLHNLPFEPLRDRFKRRQEELAALGAARSTHVIYGPEGIGKTRLAIEFAWRSRDLYQAIFFVRANSPEEIRSGIATLAGPDLFNLRIHPRDTEDAIFSDVLEWLRASSSWLLILDDANSEAAVESVRELLSRLNGHVIITSHQASWSSLPLLRLDSLKPEEGAALILDRTGRDRERVPARLIAQLLNGLPLALELTGDYINYNLLSLSDYLTIFQYAKTDSFAEHEHWIALPLQELNSTSVALLRLLSLLGPAPIPISFLGRQEEILSRAVALVSERSSWTFTLEAALVELVDYSLVQREGEKLFVHSVIREVNRSLMQQDYPRWLGLALQLFYNVPYFDPYEDSTRPIWDSLRPHAVEVIAQCNSTGMEDQTWRLSVQLEAYFIVKGVSHLAEPLDKEDLLHLAFRLVLARRVSPDLLLHLDAFRLREAAEGVLGDDSSLTESLPLNLLRAAADRLKTQFPEAVPDPLWMSWMLTAQSKTLDDLAATLAS